MKIGSLFSGYEGLGMGVQAVLGGDIAWVSDIDPGACKILAHRYPGVPNLGDVTAVDWSAVEPVDVLTGGFPCQDVSCAGLRKGLRPDTRSGLWTQMAYAIDQLRPSLVVAENVRGLLSAEAHSDLEPCPWCVGDGSGIPLRALGAVLGDLADIGYDASWTGIRAADVGAPHGRFRVFVVAWPAADANIYGLEAAGRFPGRLGSEKSWDHIGVGSLPSAPQDADVAARGERRLSAPGQAEGRGTRADAGGRDRAPAADAVGGGCDRRAREPIGREVYGAPAAWTGEDVHDTTDDLSALRDGPRDLGRLPSADWGAYTTAVQRWERLTRPAPNPTEPGKNGQPRLSPRFVEWMQGLPAGWVTDVPGLTRNEQLKALGNGVVWQQAAAALRLLLPEMERAVA